MRAVPHPGLGRSLRAGLVALGLMGSLPAPALAIPAPSVSAPPAATPPDMALPPAIAAGRCAPWQARPDMRITLFFGQRRPDGRRVRGREWRAFVRDVLTPHFPTGFTVLRGAGQWQDRVSGRVGREPVRIVWISAPPDPALPARINAIRDAYRQRFAQQSVGLSVAAGCGAF